MGTNTNNNRRRGIGAHLPIKKEKVAPKSDTFNPFIDEEDEEDYNSHNYTLDHLNLTLSDSENDTNDNNATFAVDSQSTAKVAYDDHIENLDDEDLDELLGITELTPKPELTPQSGNYNNDYQNYSSESLPDYSPTPDYSSTTNKTSKNFTNNEDSTQPQNLDHDNTSNSGIIFEDEYELEEYVDESIDFTQEDDSQNNGDFENDIFADSNADSENSEEYDQSVIEGTDDEFSSYLSSLLTGEDEPQVINQYYIDNIQNQPDPTPASTPVNNSNDNNTELNKTSENTDEFLDYSFDDDIYEESNSTSVDNADDSNYFIDDDGLIMFDEEDEYDEDEDDEDESWGFEEIDDTPNEHSDDAFIDEFDDSDTQLPDWDQDEYDDDNDDSAEHAEHPSESTERGHVGTRGDSSDNTPQSEDSVHKGPLNGFINKLKNKIAVIKAQVAADAKGESIPSEKSLLDDLPAYARPVAQENYDDEDYYDEDMEEDNLTDKSDKKPSKKKGKKGRKLAFLAPIAKVYGTISDFVFNILLGALNVLTKIPIIGKLFRPLLSLTRVLKKISKGLPVVLIVAVMAGISYFSVPSSVSIELPDEGAVTMSQFKYDDGTVSGLIENNGFTIADIQVDFNIYTLQPSINPLTWFIPKVVETCSTEALSIDIDSSKEISAECGEVSGYIPRVSGEIH